jgi:GNAT superfamily N-acetyltransferase
MKLRNHHGQSIDVTFRFASPEDAPVIVSMTRKQHGSAYASGFFDEGWVRSRLERNALRFCFACLEGGQVAGMVGSDAENTFPGTVVFILLTLEKVLRGYGLGRLLLRFLFDHTRREDAASIYGYCIGHDTRSQENHIEMGFQMTGMALNRYYYDTAHAENLAGELLPRKRNHVIACLKCAKNSAGTLWAPEKYRSFIADVYTRLGAGFAFAADAAAAAEASRSKVTISENPAQKYADIFAEKAGRDFGEVIDALLAGRAGEEDQTYNAYINLNNGSAPFAAEALEARGFFFTGVQPLSADTEYMVMHCSPRLPVPFDALKVVPEFSGQLARIRRYYEEALRDAH